MLQVINCEEQPGGCTADGEAESIFDIEKEKLVHSLFRVLQATAGTNMTQASSSGQKEPKLLTLSELMKRFVPHCLTKLTSTASRDACTCC